MSLNTSRKYGTIVDKTIYYILAIAPVLISLVFFLRDRPAEIVPTYLWWFHILSVVVLASTLISFLGIVGYGSPQKENDLALESLKFNGWPSGVVLTVCFVSYGRNKDTICRSIQQASRLLHQYKVPHRIEVLLEIDLGEHLRHIPNLEVIVIPQGYRSPHGVLYKGRAMQYGVERRRCILPHYNNHWILHCDEESIVTEEALAGIASFVSDPRNHESIGQGEIQYNSVAYGKNIFIAALDSARTGDDLGRFRFQYKYARDSLIGVHGSFLLVPATVEDRIGFDHGPTASLTEDAYFAFFAASHGIKFGWVTGFIREQSPFTLMDLFRQRRRWLNGIALLCVDDRIELRRRLLLFFCLAAWRLSWFCAFLSLPRIFHIVPCSDTLRILSAGFAGCAFGMYLVGAYRNIGTLTVPLFKKLTLFSQIALLVPLAAFVESVVVFYAIFRPSQQFYVVRKDSVA